MRVSGDSLAGLPHRRRSCLTWCRVESPWTSRFRSTWGESRRTCRFGGVQVESVVQLLDEGNTVPFITRYRKERTGNLNEVVIREIQLRVQRLRELAERKETILKAIEAQGKLTPDLADRHSRRPTIPSGSKTFTCPSSRRSEPRRPTPAIAGWSPWPSGSGPATRHSPIWPRPRRNS